jgi:type I restriction enzyme S subunit
MPEWSHVRLGDLVTIKHGYAFKGEHICDEPAVDILLTPGNFAIGGGFKGGKLKFYLGDVSEEFVLSPRDLLVTMTDLSKGGDTLGYPAWVPDWDGCRFLHNQRLGLVQVNDCSRLDPSFLYYVLCSRGYRNEVLASATGSTVRHTSPSKIRAFSFSIPPLQEQRNIANVLNALDDKIELNLRMNETLEATARTLFKSWFIDFDPVRAKLAGRAPACADATASASLFPDELDRVGIPKGWRQAALGSWVEALSGGTPSKSDPALWNGTIPWISPKVMVDLHADRAEAHVAESAIGNGTRLAPAGSTLVMVRGMGLHEKVRVSQARRDVTFNQDVKALIPRGIEPSLLFFALLHAQEKLLEKVESSGHGTGKLPTEILLGYELTMPPEVMQARLTQIFDSVGDRIAVAREESRTLAALRDALLPGLLSGQLRICDAEREVEKVA